MSGASSEPVQFRIEPSEHDWIAANWLMVRHAWLWRRLLRAFGIVWAFYALLLIVPPTLEYGWSTYWTLYHLAEAAAYAGLVMLVVIGLTLVLLPRRVRKQFADTRRLTAGHVIDIASDSLTSRNAVGSATVRWKQFLRWHESARVIVAVITERDAVIIPKAQVAPAIIDAVRNNLIAAQVERGLT